MVKNEPISWFNKHRIPGKLQTHHKGEVQEWFLRHVEHFKQDVRDWTLKTVVAGLQQHFLHSLMHHHASN